MLIDEIKLDKNFTYREQELNGEIYSFQLYQNGKCIFNESKVKCPYESLRLVKQLINEKLKITLKNLKI